MRPDAVTLPLRRAVIARDGGCVAAFLDPDPARGECRDRWGNARPYNLLAILTVDHVKDQPAMGKRAPSDPSHLVTVCWHHHLNGWATAHRPLLREYLKRVSGAAAASPSSEPGEAD